VKKSVEYTDYIQAYKIYDPKARDLAKLYLIDRNLTKRDQCNLHQSLK
jgi:hypothetical protein